MTQTAIRLSFVALLAAMLAPAATLRSLVNEGNERYEGKEYEDATKVYRLAAEQAPESPYAHFNLGAALYRTGEYTQAIGAFQHAAQMARESGDGRGEALSRYNLGNAFFRSSEADAQTNPRQAIAALEHSVESYRQALQLDPKLADAAHNIALARRKMKEFLDQMRNAPASGGSQQDQQQLQDQIEQNLSRQKELSDKREELEQRQKDQQDQQNLQQDAEKLAQEQQQLEQQSRDLTEQLDKPDATPEQQQARENLEQAAQQQQQASQQIGQQQMQQAEGSQEKAQQSLENALASLGRDPRQAESSPQPQQPGDSQQQPQQQLQALEQTPQDILNEERTNRKRRRMLMLGSQAQVEKDW